MKVFLSYSLQDERHARELRERLAAAGLDVWDPNERLFPGDNWALAIGKALEQAQAMVVLLSPDSVSSQNVRREIEYALGSTKYEKRLIPVVVRETRDIPWILKKLPLMKLRDNVDEVGQRIVEILQPERKAAAHRKAAG